MNSFFKQLHSESEKIRMTADERATMLARLEAEMRVPQVVESPYFTQLSFVTARMPAFAFALVLIVTGGISYAAEGALPGDLLYPIKVSINERVTSSFAFSDESKAEVHAAFAARRMEEAEMLIAQGSFTANAKTELEANFDHHASEVARLVKSVEAKDSALAAGISADFSSSIAAHGAVIAKLSFGSSDTNTKNESATLAINLSKRTDQVERAAANMDASGGVSPQTARSMAAKTTLAPAPDTMAMTMNAESDTDLLVAKRIGDKVLSILIDAEAKLGMIQTLDASTTAKIERRISDIRSIVGRVREQEGDSATARRIVEQALNEAAIIRAYIEAEGTLKTNFLQPIFDGTTDGGSAVSDPAGLIQDAVINGAIGL